jgi:hypothetical protein
MLTRQRKKGCDMADKRNAVLDLGELFGQDDPIIIRLAEGDEYPLLRPDALGPTAVLKFESLQKRIVEMQQRNEIDEKLTADLDQLVRDCLALLVGTPALPIERLTFVQAMTVMDFYSAEVTEAQKKVIREPVKIPKASTGEISSQI